MGLLVTVVHHRPRADATPCTGKYTSELSAVYYALELIRLHPRKYSRRWYFGRSSPPSPLSRKPVAW